MSKVKKHIAVLEPSKIVYEGLCVLMSKLEYDLSFFHPDNLSELEGLLGNKKISIVMVNPTMVQNRLTEFAKIKRQFPQTYWIGIIYQFFDNSILGFFDDSFQIVDDVYSIIGKINRLYDLKSYEETDSQDEPLTEREISVLQLLTQGLSNREIADILILSVHTVNTHRRNIMAKTGIRSLPGLTIYAVTKGIISLE